MSIFNSFNSSSVNSFNFFNLTPFVSTFPGQLERYLLHLHLIFSVLSFRLYL
uniref:Uncharacterized protein n=1 Tax=Meloidogyne enterolobii TaxID=390850 RepID=A0A6V7UG22_MELEN|nr:unnamed protein product [Meloidogyne enterolobii]